MANQVTFQIKIETLGADSVKNVTMDAEELGRVVHEVTNEQEKLNTKLLDINQTCGFHKVKSVKFSTFLSLIEFTSSLFYRLITKVLIDN